MNSTIIERQDHYFIWIVSASLDSHSYTNIEQEVRQSIQLSNHWNTSGLTLASYEATHPLKLKAAKWNLKYVEKYPTSS